MEDLFDKKLLNKKGGFTIFGEDPILKRLNIIVYLFYSEAASDMDKLLKELKAINVESHRRNLGIEIVFVPLEYDPEIVKAQFKKQGNWYAVPVTNDLTRELIFKYGIIKDPTVMVVRRDGKIISWDAESEIKDIELNVLITWPER